jgi:3-dehydro-L-gulonate 2-dehydrogenase
MADKLFISYDKLEETFLSVLGRNGFFGDRARTCARIFAQNSLDGVYTHGVNRFPRFISYIQKGYVIPENQPELVSSFGAIEQWNGRLGPGPNNALDATRRSVELAGTHGIGCVGLANTNHWMRGGYYGREAAGSGCIFIGWTNAIVGMPTWGAASSKLGNNPLVLAVPHAPGAVVLDMAMSQYSYGTMEAYNMEGRRLPYAGGFDRQGKLTDDPATVLQTGLAAPIGYWKGAGLALLLDLLAAVISGGDATFRITGRGEEYGVSQVFISIDPSRFAGASNMETMVKEIIEDYHQSVPASEKERILYPGERVLMRRKENLEKGIPVEKQVWDSILDLDGSG